MSTTLHRRLVVEARLIVREFLQVAENRKFLKLLIIKIRIIIAIINILIRGLEL